MASKVTLVTAIAFDSARQAESGYADPVIHVAGSLPGPANAFKVHRAYVGPQGVYSETLLLVDSEDTVLWERGQKLIELRGEMFEDLFRDEIRDAIMLDAVGEYYLVSMVDGAEVGRIPVFVEAPESVEGSPARADALRKALSKSAVVWLHIPQAPSKSSKSKSDDVADVTVPAWYVAKGDSIYVLTGPQGGGEQHLPGLLDAQNVQCTIKSKAIKASIDAVSATTRVLDNDSDEFTAIATDGMGVRLNSPDGGKALTRWRKECAIVELSLALA